MSFVPEPQESHCFNKPETSKSEAALAAAAEQLRQKDATIDRLTKLLGECQPVMQSFAYCSLVPPTMDKVVPDLLTRIDKETGGK